MELTTLGQVIDYLLDQGIEISLERKDGKISYNVNTHAKSDLILVEDQDEGVLKCYKRYSDTDVVYLGQPLEDVIKDIAYEVKDCMCSRDYVCGNWLKIMVDFDIVEVQYEQQRVLKFN